MAIDEEEREEPSTGQSRGNQSDSVEPPTSPFGIQQDANHDPVEVALATALERASAAGQWTVCEVLARELEGRRRASASVVELDAARGWGSKRR